MINTNISIEKPKLKIVFAMEGTEEDFAYLLKHMDHVIKWEKLDTESALADLYIFLYDQRFSNG